MLQEITLIPWQHSTESTKLFLKHSGLRVFPVCGTWSSCWPQNFFNAFYLMLELLYLYKSQFKWKLFLAAGWRQWCETVWKGTASIEGKMKYFLLNFWSYTLMNELLPNCIFIMSSTRLACSALSFSNFDIQNNILCVKVGGFLYFKESQNPRARRLLIKRWFHGNLTKHYSWSSCVSKSLLKRDATFF